MPPHAGLLSKHLEADIALEVSLSRFLMLGFYMPPHASLLNKLLEADLALEIFLSCMSDVMQPQMLFLGK